MKVTIEFDLCEQPEDEVRMGLCLQAKRMHDLLWCFSHNVKHRTASLTDEQCIGYEKAMEDFFRMVEEEKVDLE